MGKPVATIAGGTCASASNICLTPAPPPPGNMVPVTYPSIGQLTATSNPSPNVNAGGSAVVTKASTIASTTGDEAGTGGGVTSMLPPGGKVEFTSASTSVFANGNGLIRESDTTSQNNGNAQGTVIGGFPLVLAGD